MRRLDVPGVVVSARAPARTGKTWNEPSTPPVRRAGPATPLLRCPACLGPVGRTLGAAFDGRLECAACGGTFDARDGRNLLPPAFRRLLADLPFPIRAIASVLLLALDLAARSTLIAWKGK